MRKLTWISIAVLVVVYLLNDGSERTPDAPSSDRAVVAPNGDDANVPSSTSQPRQSRQPSSESTDEGALSGNTPQATQAVQLPDLYVTGDRVNQRTGPSTENGRMGQLSRGARVRQLRSANGWTEIVSSLGRGWMSSAYLSTDAPPKLDPVSRPRNQRTVAAPTSREISQAKQNLIRQSIAAYPGSCPCPFSRDRAGRRCGGRSAWSRPGGYSPMCYESDISPARLESYLARRRGAAN